MIGDSYVEVFNVDVENAFADQHPQGPQGFEADHPRKPAISCASFLVGMMSEKESGRSLVSCLGPDTQSGAGPRPGAAQEVPPSSYSPTGKPGSTIAEAGLNFRVRNGNGCGPCSMDGGINLSEWSSINRMSF